MLNRGIMALVAVSLLFAGSAFAKKDVGTDMCDVTNVVGSYIRVGSYSFEDAAGTVFPRTWFRSLNLNAGGTVLQWDSASQDMMMNIGMVSNWTGSWACRADGTLLVTVYSAVYIPLPAGEYIPWETRPSVADVELWRNQRTTYLFSVVDADTLELIACAVRRYTMADDPSDPEDGSITSRCEGTSIYERLVPSDADLLLP